MLTNRRSTMGIPHSRRTSWHPQSNNPVSTPTTTTFTTTSAKPPPGSPDSDPHCRTTSLLTSTTPSLPNHRITNVLGTVHGATTCARKDTKSFLKAVNNANEAKSLTHMLYQARDQAVERMLRDATARGANAVVGMGFGESEILGFAQVSVYGTAVFVEREGFEGVGDEKTNPFQ